ncbi:unnamed protein product, partial [Discosporangium mesarthrocarpum]
MRSGASRTRTQGTALIGCSLDVRVPQEACFLSQPIPVEVFLMKNSELQHASNIPLQVWLEEEFQQPVKAEPSSGVTLIAGDGGRGGGRVGEDVVPLIMDGVVKFSVVVEEHAIHGHKVRVMVSSLAGLPGGIVPPATAGGGGAPVQLAGRSPEFT